MGITECTTTLTGKKKNSHKELKDFDYVVNLPLNEFKWGLLIPLNYVLWKLIYIYKVLHTQFKSLKWIIICLIFIK